MRPIEGGVRASNNPLRTPAFGFSDRELLGVEGGDVGARGTTHTSQLLRAEAIEVVVGTEGVLLLDPFMYGNPPRRIPGHAALPAQPKRLAAV